MRKFPLLLCALGVAGASSAQVTATLASGRTATMSNGIISVSIDAGGRVTKMTHPDNGTANILGSTGIYFDYTADKNRQMSPGTAKIVKQTDDYAEILYSNTSNADIRFSQGYILRAGESGLYTYVIAEGVRSDSVAANTVKEARVCTRLASKFLNGYVDDSMQGEIPSNSVMSAVESGGTGNANYVMDATYMIADTVYTKYKWAQFIDRDSVHGLMNDKVGVWDIPVSYEWINGGPMRQELTVHATGKSPITIQMLEGEHLGGGAQSYRAGEKHMFGPIFIYVNSGESTSAMIADAKNKAHELKEQWPFKWFENDLCPIERATVSGKLVLPSDLDPEGYRMVLAKPGSDLIHQGKGYMFWSKTDATGAFVIPNVRPGEYALYAYATKGGIIEEMERRDIRIDAGNIDLGSIEWNPDRLEKEYWRIGEADRTARGFKFSDHFRDYGLYDKVPTAVNFTPGVSDPSEDWYYAQVNKGVWTVNFNLDEVPAEGARLWAGVAASQGAQTVTVKVNGTTAGTWNYTNDSAISRCATQAGRYWSSRLDIPASSLKAGANKISFQTAGTGNKGVMWDCIKLEGGAPSSSGIQAVEADSPLPYSVYTLGGVYLGEFESLVDLELTSGVYLWRQGPKSGKLVK